MLDEENSTWLSDELRLLFMVNYLFLLIVQSVGFGFAMMHLGLVWCYFLPNCVPYVYLIGTTSAWGFLLHIWSDTTLS